MLSSDIRAPGAYAYDAFVLVQEGERGCSAPVGGSMTLCGAGEGSCCAGRVCLPIGRTITTCHDVWIEAWYEGVRLLAIKQAYIGEAHSLLLLDKSRQLLAIGVV